MRRAFLQSAYKHQYSGGTCLLQVEGTADELGHLPHKWGEEKYFQETIIHEGVEVTVCNFWRYKYRDGATFPIPIEVIEI